MHTPITKHVKKLASDALNIPTANYNTNKCAWEKFQSDKQKETFPQTSSKNQFGTARRAKTVHTNKLCCGISKLLNCKHFEISHLQIFSWFIKHIFRRNRFVISRQDFTIKVKKRSALPSTLLRSVVIAKKRGCRINKEQTLIKASIRQLKKTFH